MRWTLLEMTQDILSAMDSDEVNSISDTTESAQVVKVIKSAYGDIAITANLPRDYGLFSLEASTDNTKPVTMFLPDDVLSVEWIKYNKETTSNTDQYRQKLIYMMPETFSNMVDSFAESDSNVVTYNVTLLSGTASTFMCYNDRGPTYYTTFDDGTVLFDAYDASVDTTLQSSKMLCWGQFSYPWQESDTFQFPLDDRAQQLLFQKAKALAFAELKQTQHVSAEKSVRELKINSQHTKQKTKLQRAIDRAPNYGR